MYKFIISADVHFLKIVLNIKYVHGLINKTVDMCKVGSIVLNLFVTIVFKI